MKNFYFATEDYIDSHLLEDLTNSLINHNFISSDVKFRYEDMTQNFIPEVGFVDSVVSTDSTVTFNIILVNMAKGSAVDIFAYEVGENFDIKDLSIQEPILGFEHARTTLNQSGNTSIAQRIPKHFEFKRKYPNTHMEYITDSQEVFVENSTLKVNVDNNIYNITPGIFLQFRTALTIGIHYHSNLKGVNNIQIYNDIFDFENDCNKIKSKSIFLNFDHNNKSLKIDIRLDKTDKKNPKNQGKPNNDPNIGLLVMYNELIKKLAPEYKIIVNKHGLKKEVLKNGKLSNYIKNNENLELIF